STDVTQLGTLVQGNGTSFTAAGDINGDGLINLSDVFLMGPILTAHNANAAAQSAYASLISASYVVSGTYNVDDASDVIYQDTAATTNVLAGNSLTATSINGYALSIAAG